MLLYNQRDNQFYFIFEQTLKKHVGRISEIVTDSIYHYKNLNMKTLKYIIAIFIIILLGCDTQIKFDKTKWAMKDDIEYPYRNVMLNDLTTNHKLSGLKYSELITFLGPPQYSDSTSLTYQVTIHYDVIDPDYLKSLKFIFNKDSIIVSFKIHEWKKNSKIHKIIKNKRRIYKNQLPANSY